MTYAQTPRFDNGSVLLPERETEVVRCATVDEAPAHLPRAPIDLAATMSGTVVLGYSSFPWDFAQDSYKHGVVLGWMPAGEHAVSFEAGALPSGLYVYRLQTPVRVETGRMLLLQ